MAKPITTEHNTFNDWRRNTNTISNNVGDPTALYTSDTGIVIPQPANVVESLNDLNIRKLAHAGGTVAYLNVTGALDVDGATTLASMSMTGNLTCSGTVSGTWNGAIISAAYGGTGLSSFSANRLLGTNAAGTLFEQKTFVSNDSTIVFDYATPGQINLQASGSAYTLLVYNDVQVGKRMRIGALMSGSSTMDTVDPTILCEIRPAYSDVTTTTAVAIFADNTTTTAALTISKTGNLAIGVNKFTVAAATGNTVVAGTLGVTGATTLSSSLGVTGAATINGNTTLGALVSNTTSLGPNTTIATFETTTATTSPTIIASFVAATFAGAEYVIQMKDTVSGKAHSSTVKVIADPAGTNSDYTEYSALNIGGECATFSTTVVTGTVNLIATPSSTNSTRFRVTAILTKA